MALRYLEFDGILLEQTLEALSYIQRDGVALYVRISGAPGGATTDVFSLDAETIQRRGRHRAVSKAEKSPGSASGSERSLFRAFEALWRWASVGSAPKLTVLVWACSVTMMMLAQEWHTSP